MRSGISHHLSCIFGTILFVVMAGFRHMFQMVLKDDQDFLCRTHAAATMTDVHSSVARLIGLESSAFSLLADHPPLPPGLDK